jgi:hypothetical protein
MKKLLIVFALMPLIILSSCKKNEDTPTPQGKDPATAEKASIDRFSSNAGTLFVRDGSNGLPAANAPVNFDVAPFITQGLSPNGTPVRYYNFDVMPVTAAPIYVLFHEGESMPVDGQLNIINVIPGDAGYNDFWQVYKVIVPADYVANVVTSYQEIVSNGYTVTVTNTLVNCPVVPEGSTASMRYKSTESDGLVMGWYKGKVVFYFSFFEKDLTTMNGSQIPLSDILVTFNINPDQTGGGPPSGFMTEMGSMQTHNIVQTTPEDAGYSPLWDVDVYDNADFANVMDWSSAMNSNILATGVATVNCPIVWMQ